MRKYRLTVWFQAKNNREAKYVSEDALYAVYRESDAELRMEKQGWYVFVKRFKMTQNKRRLK